MRSHSQPFICPPEFEQEYQLFQKECEECNYANATILCNNNVIRRLITYLQEKGLNSSNEITTVCVTEFLSLYAQLKPKYISTVLCVLRNYFVFLKHMKFTERAD